MSKAITELSIALLFFAVGFVAKFVAEYGDMNASNPTEQRAKAIFRQCYIGLDLVLLSIGLALSANWLKSKPAYGPLIGSYILALLLCIVMWAAAGPQRFFPMVEHQVRAKDFDGTDGSWPVRYPDIRAGIKTRAGVMTLIIGNAIGVAAIIAFVWVSL